MTSTNVRETLNYLTDAAHLLRVAAPESSAHLMSTRSTLVFEHGLAPSDLERQHVCGACGNIMIPGIAETAIHLSAAHSKRKATRRSKASARSARTEPPTKILSCGQCKRNTKIQIAGPLPAPAVRRKKVSSKVPGRITQADTPKLTANASSKKRAKNRKAGLQSLLSAAKSQQSRSSLSLGDFAKK